MIPFLIGNYFNLLSPSQVPHITSSGEVVLPHHPTILILDNDNNTHRQCKRRLGDDFNFKKINIISLLAKHCTEQNPQLLLADIEIINLVKNDYLLGLQNNSWFSKLPLIALGSAGTEISISGNTLGQAKLEEYAITELCAWDYLKKPLHMTILQSKVRNAIKINRQLISKKQNFLHFHDICTRYHKTKGKILVMEDDLHDLNFLTDLLAPHFEVISCKSDSDVRERLPDQDIDLICLDICIDGEDKGYELLDWMLVNNKNPDTPKIIISGKFTGQDISTGLTAGANDYITKPFMPGPIKARIKMHLSRNEFLKEVQL